MTVNGLLRPLKALATIYLTIASIALASAALLVAAIA